MMILKIGFRKTFEDALSQCQLTTSKKEKKMSVDHANNRHWRRVVVAIEATCTTLFALQNFHH